LEGKVERDFDAVVAGAGHEPSEILECAKLGMNGIVPTFLTADCPRTARIIRPGDKTIVLPLPVGATDRMDRREVQNVEAEFGDVWEPRLAVPERSVPTRFWGTGAREQFIPRAEARAFTVDNNAQDARVLSHEGTGIGSAQSRSGDL